MGSKKLQPRKGKFNLVIVPCQGCGKDVEEYDTEDIVEKFVEELIVIGKGVKKKVKKVVGYKLVTTHHNYPETHCHCRCGAKWGEHCKLKVEH